MATANAACWAVDASARIRSIAVTWSAVADSLAFAAAMSSGDGISGDAGRTMGADGAASAGGATEAKSTTAAHSAAVLRPDPGIAICRDLATVRLGVRFWMRHDGAPQLLASSPRLRDDMHIGNSSHMNNINHKDVILHGNHHGVSGSGVLVFLVF